MLDFSLSPQQVALREEIAEFAQSYLNEGVAQRDQEQFFDRSLWEKCGSIGLPGLSIPQAYGGRGLNALDTVLALEALGRHSEDAGFNFALAAHLLACAVPIWQFGTDEQKTNLLPALCNGKHVATNAMTEASAGSDVYRMASKAAPTDTGFLLNGHKTYCSNGPVADVVLTYATTHETKGFFGGITAFVLQKDQHAFRSTDRIDKLGLRTCQLGELFFENVELEATTVLGAVGGGGPIFHRSMEWERICLGALHIGEMERLLSKAARFAKKRRSAGKALQEYQAVMHPLADLKCRIEAGRQLLYKSAWMLSENKKVNAQAAMTKLFISETYRDFAVQMQQLFAGAAFRTPNEFERCLRDAMSATIYSGTSEVQRNIIGKSIR